MHFLEEKKFLLKAELYNTEWMFEVMDDLDFLSFSTIFQSYQNDGQVIMQGCVQWNPVYE